jgi:hypothetical protein
MEKPHDSIVYSYSEIGRIIVELLMLKDEISDTEILIALKLHPEFLEASEENGPGHISIEERVEYRRMAAAMIQNSRMLRNSSIPES